MARECITDHLDRWHPDLRERGWTNSDAVSQADARGGQVTQRIHAIGSHGFGAIVLDSVGNRIVIHSTADA